MTEAEKLGYIEGEPLRCSGCGSVLGRKRPGCDYRVCDRAEGDIFIKCRKCKRIMGIKS